MNTAVATTRNDIRALLAKPDTIKELGRVATKHLTADRLARLVLSACNRVPKLLECTPQSVLTCALTCSQYGVEPDGRHAHLIPYGNTCTLIIDWKGLVALGRRAGVEGIVADTICASDEFVYYRDEAGTHFKHVPKFGDRGEIVGAYSTARIDGQFDVEVMTREEIDGIRKRSKAGSSGPWVSDFGEMAKKTAIRRHSKRWPLSEEVAGAFLADDDLPNGSPAPEIRKPLFNATVDVPPADPDQIPGAEVPEPPKRGRPARQTPPPEAVEAPPSDFVPPDESEPIAEVQSIQDQLADFVCVDCTATFDQFKDAVLNLQLAKGAEIDTWDDFNAVPVKLATRCLGAKTGLKTQLGLEKERENA